MLRLPLLRSKNLKSVVRHLHRVKSVIHSSDREYLLSLCRAKVNLCKSLQAYPFCVNRILLQEKQNCFGFHQSKVPELRYSHKQKQDQKNPRQFLRKNIKSSNIINKLLFHTILPILKPIRIHPQKVRYEYPYGDVQNTIS